MAPKSVWPEPDCVTSWADMVEGKWDLDLDGLSYSQLLETAKQLRYENHQLKELKYPKYSLYSTPKTIVASQMLETITLPRIGFAGNHYLHPFYHVKVQVGHQYLGYHVNVENGQEEKKRFIIAKNVYSLHEQIAGRILEEFKISPTLLSGWHHKARPQVKEIKPKLEIYQREVEY